MKKQGMLIVVSGPSGAGKGTLCKKLLGKIENLFISISATTRPPRHGEKDGINYFFIGNEIFEDKIAKGEFIEWAKVYNNYYGTPKERVLKELSDGKDVLLEIDIQGAAQVKEAFPEGVFIFISPPNMIELKNRIIKRGSDNHDSIELRVKSAKKEIKASCDYDYIVLNDDLEKATLMLQSIVLAERCKVSRNKKEIQAIKGGY